MLVIKLCNATLCLGGLRMALRLHIPVHLTTQKTCFWRPTMLIFKLHNATQCLGLRMAPHMQIPVHITNQKTYFWRSTMLFFKMHNATKSLGGSGWRSICTYLCTLQTRKRVFGDLGCLSSTCTMLQCLGGSGWRSVGTNLCTCPPNPTFLTRDGPPHARETSGVLADHASTMPYSSDRDVDEHTKDPVLDRLAVLCMGVVVIA